MRMMGNQTEKKMENEKGATITPKSIAGHLGPARRCLWSGCRRACLDGQGDLASELTISITTVTMLTTL